MLQEKINKNGGNESDETQGNTPIKLWYLMIDSLWAYYLDQDELNHFTYLFSLVSDPIQNESFLYCTTHECREVIKTFGKK